MVLYNYLLFTREWYDTGSNTGYFKVGFVDYVNSVYSVCMLVWIELLSVIWSLITLDDNMWLPNLEGAKKSIRQKKL